MLKTHPYDSDRPDKRSPAQKAAHSRNFRIFNLRGLASMAGRLTGPRRTALIALVDAELALIGAEPESVREVKREVERAAKWARMAADRAQRDADAKDLIPF